MMREYVHYRNWQGLYIRVFSSPGKTDCSTCRSILRFEPLLPTPCSSGCTVCPYLPCLAHCLPPRREHRMALPRCDSAFSSVPRSLQPRRPGRNGTCVEWNMLSEWRGSRHCGNACTGVFVVLCCRRCSSVEMQLLSPPLASLANFGFNYLFLSPHAGGRGIAHSLPAP